MSQQNSVSLNSQGLKEIVEGTSAETGEGFFDALVQHLARAIGTKCAWVTEWIADQRSLRALSFWAGDAYIADFEYAIADTPCASVIENRPQYMSYNPIIKSIGSVANPGLKMRLQMALAIVAVLVFFSNESTGAETAGLFL